jgi:hypothetical protein
MACVLSAKKMGGVFADFFIYKITLPDCSFMLCFARQGMTVIE